jgi:hypothetical protein
MATEDIDSSRLAVLEATCNERFTALAHALSVALAANEKRLDGLNEFRAALSDQANRMMTRAEAIASAEATATQIRGEFAGLRERVDRHDDPDYLLWGVVVTALVGLAAGLWMVIGLKIDQATAPLALQLAHMAEHPGAECPVLHPPGRTP